MDHSFVARLAETRGVPSAATYVLNADSLDAEAERFLRERFEALAPEHLLRWLALADPLDADAPRSTPQIVRRIVERLGDGGLLLALDPRPLREVRDQDVRDELIERLREPCGAYWFRFALLASGGAVFAKVRDLERELVDGSGVPVELLEPGTPVPSLTSLLFGDRRDDAACRRQLLAALRDPGTRFYALWILLKAGLLVSIGTLDDVVGQVASQEELEPHEWGRVKFLLEIAKAWPREAERRGWFVKRSLEAVRRGVSWGTLWWEIDASLRDEVALASLSTDRPAPWTLNAVLRAPMGPDTWRTVLELLELEPDVVALARLLQHAEWPRRLGARAPSQEETDAARKEFEPTGWDRLADVYRPSDDDADEEFVRATARLGRGFALKVLLGLPLTKARAVRILGLAIEEGDLWRLERVEELAGIVGVTSLPVPLPRSASSMGIYRTLVADGATAALRSAIDASIASANTGDPLAVYGAVGVAGLDPQGVTEAHRKELRKLVEAAPLSTMVSLQAEAPWLLSEADVVAAATDPEKPWGHIDSLPRFLLPVMEAKAASGPNAGFAERLLDRCEALGLPRRKILALALERLRGSPEAVSAGWLSSKLDSNALWEDPGTQIVGELLRERTPERVNATFRLCHHTSTASGATSLEPIIHTVLARVLIRIARTALEISDKTTAERALTGLAHLSAAPRLRDSLRALRKLSTDEDIVRLVDLNSELLRRGVDVATLEGVAHALGALAGIGELEAAI